MTKAARKAPRRIIITGSRGKAKKKPTLVEKYQEARKKKPAVPADWLDSSLGEAQDLVYDGWDLYSRDPRGAKECFEEALELDPDLADAYNGLAGLAADNKRFEEAEALYRTAFEKARAALGTEDPQAFAWWGELDTRPYMRARHGLGLLLIKMGRYRDAVAEFKDLLRRNPNDNQGIRYLVAPTLLRGDDLDGALGEFDWYKRHYPEDGPDPHFLLDWGLALFLARRFEESAARFRDVIFENPYLIPFALGRRPKTLPIWHSNNLMYRDYAREYFDWHKGLWTDQPEARRFLQFIWEDPEVRCDYWQWVDLWERASDLEVGRQRSAVLSQIYRVEERRLSPAFFTRLKEHTAAYHETPKGRVS
jgi:tetratricopeptide (TPR) repeat protein